MCTPSHKRIRTSIHCFPNDNAAKQKKKTGGPKKVESGFFFCGELATSPAGRAFVSRVAHWPSVLAAITARRPVTQWSRVPHAPPTSSPLVEWILRQSCTRCRAVNTRSCYKHICTIDVIYGRDRSVQCIFENFQHDEVIIHRSKQKNTYMKVPLLNFSVDTAVAKAQCNKNEVNINVQIFIYIMKIN